MMRTLRIFRTTGDSLGCWFSPEGSLSSAVLLVEEKELDVSSQLPGLTAENAVEYLADLGYVHSHDPECIRIGQVMNELLEGTEFFIETVLRGGGCTILSAVLNEDRERACCRRSFVAVYHKDLGKPLLEAVRNYAHTKEFLARTKCMSREYNNAAK